MKNFLITLSLAGVALVTSTLYPMQMQKYAMPRRPSTHLDRAPRTSLRSILPLTTPPSITPSIAAPRPVILGTRNMAALPVPTIPIAPIASSHNNSALILQPKTTRVATPKALATMSFTPSTEPEFVSDWLAWQKKHHLNAKLLMEKRLVLLETMISIAKFNKERFNTYERWIVADPRININHKIYVLSKSEKFNAYQQWMIANPTININYKIHVLQESLRTYSEEEDLRTAQITPPQQGAQPLDKPTLTQLSPYAKPWNPTPSPEDQLVALYRHAGILLEKLAQGNPRGVLTPEQNQALYTMSGQPFQNIIAWLERMVGARNNKNSMG